MLLKAGKKNFNPFEKLSLNILIMTETVMKQIEHSSRVQLISSSKQEQKILQRRIMPWMTLKKQPNQRYLCVYTDKMTDRLYGSVNPIQITTSKPLRKISLYSQRNGIKRKLSSGLTSSQSWVISLMQKILHGEKNRMCRNGFLNAHKVRY